MIPYPVNQKMDLIKQLLREYHQVVTTYVLEAAMKCYYDDEGLINWILQGFPELISSELLEQVVDQGLTHHYFCSIEWIFDKYSDRVTSKMLLYVIREFCLKFQFEKVKNFLEKHSQVVDQSVFRLAILWANRGSQRDLFTWMFERFPHLVTSDVLRELLEEHLFDSDLISWISSRHTDLMNLCFKGSGYRNR